MLLLHLTGTGSGLARCLSMDGTSSEKIKHIPLDIAAQERENGKTPRQNYFLKKRTVVRDR